MVGKRNQKFESMAKEKIQKISRKRKRGREEEKDRLSDLPDAVLQHIMNFMNTRDVVRTCVLSKRWKNLWKHVTTLSFSSLGKVLFYNKFVPKFLANRDASTSLIDLNIDVYGFKAPKLLTGIAKYAAQHNAQHLNITTQNNFRGMPTSFFPLMFSCHSLTSLVFGTCVGDPPVELPKSLLLPTLKTLRLFNVRFDAIDHHCVEPFSACSVLNTLTLEGYSFCNDADTFCITNSSLSILKISNSFVYNVYPRNYKHKIILSTSNLASITIGDNIIFSDDQLSSTCDLPFLEEVNIKILSSPMNYSFVAGWLQVLSHAKRLKLSFRILYDVQNLDTMEIQSPCFVRLESLKIVIVTPHRVFDEGVNIMVRHLLQNSTITTVAVCHQSLINHYHEILSEKKLLK
ncbi:hypothetical protein V8G54_004058 [Vigna mungo]|uniref:F-box domain-containing protein n=1 Tax=Vigna mungo TaxID=3915 RepID=A0AAQ3PE84_VIGMU